MCTVGEILAGLGKGQRLGSCSQQGSRSSGTPKHPRLGLKPSLPLDCSPDVAMGSGAVPAAALSYNLLPRDPKAAPARV